MRTIPETYTKNGYSFRLQKRSPKAAIYAQIHKNGRQVALEVVKIRSRAASSFIRAGEQTEIAAGEFLPSNEEWGRFGWTYSGSRAEVAAHGRWEALNGSSVTPT